MKKKIKKEKSFSTSLSCVTLFVCKRREHTVSQTNLAMATRPEASPHRGADKSRSTSAAAPLEAARPSHRTRTRRDRQSRPLTRTLPQRRREELCAIRTPLAAAYPSRTPPTKRLLSSRHQNRAKSLRIRVRVLWTDRGGGGQGPGRAAMVVMEGNGGAGKITIGVCVMEKKVGILTLWSVEVFLFLLLGGSRILANTWMLDAVLSSWLLIDSCSCSSSACVSISSAYVSIGRLLLLDFSKNAGCGSFVVASGTCPRLIKFLISSFLQVFSSPMEQILERLRAFGEFEVCKILPFVPSTLHFPFILHQFAKR